MSKHSRVVEKLKENPDGLSIEDISGLTDLSQTAVADVVNNPDRFKEFSKDDDGRYCLK